MKRVFLTLLFLFFAAQAWPATQTEESIVIDGSTRTYTLVSPATQPARLRPLVLFFHGGASAIGWPEKSELISIADERGWFLAYPQAQLANGGIWESGSWGVGGNVPRLGSNDFSFVEALIQDLAARFPIDTAKVFAVGHSNGGHFVHRLACQRSEWLRGVVSSGASRSLAAHQEGCPAQPLPMLIMNGTEDKGSPYDCPSMDCLTHGGPFIGAVQTAENWSAINGCLPAPRSFTWPVIGHPINQHQFYRCSSGKNVTLLEIVGAGHVWPPSLNQDDLSAAWIQKWLVAKSR